MKIIAHICEGALHHRDTPLCEDCKPLIALADHEAALAEAVGKEREACAVAAWSVGMDMHGPQKPGNQYDSREVGSACAIAIRARSDK